MHGTGKNDKLCHLREFMLVKNCSDREKVRYAIYEIRSGLEVGKITSWTSRVGMPMVSLIKRQQIRCFHLSGPPLRRAPALIAEF